MNVHEKDKYNSHFRILITKNEIRRIERALASVADWADEIVVVDSGSDDGTLEVVRKFTDRVYHRDFEGFGQQYTYAHGLTKNKWVMYIDGDEEVSPELRDEIIGLFKTATPRPTGIPHRGRRSIWADGSSTGGGIPTYILRIYRKSRGTWEKGLHPKLHIDGKLERLEHPFLHYNYRDISHQIMTVDRYSTIASKNRSIRVRESR